MVKAGDGDGRIGGRDRLLATARRLFTSRGISNVGINEVTDTAGVARMTLYNNFTSKDALILAVYKEMAAEVLRELRGMHIASELEEGRVAAVFDLFAVKAEEADYRGCPFIHASLQVSAGAGAVHSLVRSYKQALREHVLGLLDEARTDRGELADQFVILLDGAVTEAYLQGVANPALAAKRAALALLRVTDVTGRSSTVGTV